MSMNSSIPQKNIEAYREKTYRYPKRLRLKNANQAVNFVNERGFIFFWPIKGVELPSLWCAVAGNRPVPNNHDDPAHITWRWKDDLLDKKRWYYARILRKRITVISLELLPCFYALSPNYGTPEEDYLLEYQQGKLTQEEKMVYEALLDNGAMNSLMLRKEAHLSSPENTSRYNRALDNLQRDFRILPVGIAEAGAWRYSYIFEPVHTFFPNLIDQAYQIKESQARIRILESYFSSVGAARFKDIHKLFRWKKEDITRALQRLVETGFLRDELTIVKNPDPYYILANLVS